jgi:hypothetical protein
MSALIMLVQHGSSRVDLGEWKPPPQTWFWVYGAAAFAMLVIVGLILWSWRADDLGGGEVAARIAVIGGTIASLAFLGLAVESIIDPPVTGGARDAGAAVAEAVRLGGAGLAVGLATLAGFFVTPAMRARLRV